MKSNQVSIPVIKSDRPLKTGIVEKEDVQAYLALDQDVLCGNTNRIQRLVAVKHVPSFPFPLMIVDLEDKRLIESMIFVIEDEGIRINKSYDTGRGLTVNPEQ